MSGKRGKPAWPDKAEDWHAIASVAAMPTLNLRQMSDHIFLYVSAAITLAIVILSLLTPRPGRERERQR
jgi:hypothetical protein